MIRLARFGKKKYPTYRFVVSDKRKDTKGTYLESLGQYNPNTKPPVLEIKADRVKYWLGVGARLSDTVHNLLIAKGVISGDKRSMMHSKKKKEGDEEVKPQVAKEPKSESAKEPAKQEAAVPKEPKSEAKTEETKPEEKKPESVKKPV